MTCALNIGTFWYCNVTLSVSYILWRIRPNDNIHVLITSPIAASGSLFWRSTKWCASTTMQLCDKRVLRRKNLQWGHAMLYFRCICLDIQDFCQEMDLFQEWAEAVLEERMVILRQLTQEILHQSKGVKIASKGVEQRMEWSEGQVK